MPVIVFLIYRSPVVFQSPHCVCVREKKKRKMMEKGGIDNIDEATLAGLRKLVEDCKQNPQLLRHPSLAFFTSFLQRLGLFFYFFSKFSCPFVYTNNSLSKLFLGLFVVSLGAKIPAPSNSVSLSITSVVQFSNLGRANIGFLWFYS